MESELKKWLEYLYFIEPPVSEYDKLTQYQREDIEFTKKTIKELEGKINEERRQK
jgi:hypothetical protein